MGQSLSNEDSVLCLPNKKNEQELMQAVSMLTCWSAALAAAFVLAAPQFIRAQPAPASKAVAVERVTLKYQQGQISLLSRAPLTKVLPPSDTLPTGVEAVCGFWYELRGTTNQVLYRRITANPILNVTEKPDPESITPKRVESIPGEKTFSFLIPRPKDGEQLVIFCSPLEPARRTEPAHEAARIIFTPVNK